MTDAQRQAMIRELRVRDLKRRILVRAAVNAGGQLAVGLGAAIAAAAKPDGCDNCDEAALASMAGAAPAAGGAT
jgi:hypothetical protein